MLSWQDSWSVLVHYLQSADDDARCRLREAAAVPGLHLTARLGVGASGRVYAAVGHSQCAVVAARNAAVVVKVFDDDGASAARGDGVAGDGLDDELPACREHRLLRMVERGLCDAVGTTRSTIQPISMIVPVTHVLRLL